MRIAIYAFTGITMFHLSVPQMVFDEVARQGLAPWQTILFSDDSGPIATAEGYQITGVSGPEVASDAEVVVVPSWYDDGRPAGQDLRRLLVARHDRGATIAGLCLGTFPIADAGLLAGRKAVTHWQGFDQLTRRHPDLEIDDSVLYIDHGDVITSAGTASALDACLHMVRTRLGAAAANQVARSLVIAPHRDGGQAQYIQRPLPEQPDDDPISAVLDWAVNHLDESLSVECLAAVAHMSVRTFNRSFRSSTGATPASWVRMRRLDEARRALETTSLSIDQIAVNCGFGSVVTLRQNFAAAFQTTPTEYRRRFEARPATT
ncbi:transcriptional regulator, AraC family with amidase-like domain [Brevibacterium sp. 239c]|uniref:GlxA family transcriptional regulator n=1 Tax=Brevibacterium sp. 239c TaxID=1965356 RepID=UPI000C3EBAC6|nr:helix-turn-helix domain-containing protein [Brevibacterium sp. 239c]SMX95994.1 transcriptional regulator, AraC family with amidase-like domain [Brevibacterium sp. 239c]